jgi:UDP-glucose 4-epimerase
MRVLVTGMGGELGTRVAQLLEEESEVREILGVDFVPPRRRLRRSEFRRIDPRDREKLTDVVTEFAPTAVAHFGVYEPASRVPPRQAAEYTHASTVAALGAAARTGKLERVALRSGLVVYGRGRGRPGVPDESAPVAPTTPYGRTCLEVEALAVDLGRRHDFPVAALRMAPEAGSHVPSPLGRLLRLPVVPVPALADPAFQLLHQEDAARSMVAALMLGADGPFNVVGPGAASVWQAVRLGGRVPWPVLGPGWRIATRVTELAGAPVPPHILEIITRGRTADGSKALEQLELGSMRPTQEVCTELFEWAMVTPLRPTAPVTKAAGSES